MNYATVCQACATHSAQPAKAYVRCDDCEIFLCSQCDYTEHCGMRGAASGYLQGKGGNHKRVRICEECEEQECAFQCTSCEQVLCVQCSNRLHQKGARQKHRRFPYNSPPELIRPEGAKSGVKGSGSSSVDNLISHQDNQQREIFEGTMGTEGGRAQSDSSPKNSLDRSGNSLKNQPLTTSNTEDQAFFKHQSSNSKSEKDLQQQMISPSNQKQSQYTRQSNTGNGGNGSGHGGSSQYACKDRGGYYYATSTVNSTGINHSATAKNYPSYDKGSSGRQNYNHQNVTQQQQQQYSREGGRVGSASHNTTSADYNSGTKHANTATRGSKGSGCYSSGGSSAGSHHNSYSNYNTRGGGNVGNQYENTAATNSSGYYQTHHYTNNNSANYKQPVSSSSQQQQQQSSTSSHKPPQQQKSMKYQNNHAGNNPSQTYNSGSLGGSSTSGQQSNYHGGSGTHNQSTSTHHQSTGTSTYHHNQYSSGEKYSSKNENHNHNQHHYVRTVIVDRDNNPSSSSNMQFSQMTKEQQQDYIPPQFFEGNYISIPIWQPLVKTEQNSKEMLIIQKELFNFAQKGELLIESNLFLGVLADRLQIQEYEGQRLIDQAIAMNIIHQTTRNFMKSKIMIFLSPKLDIISHESICWAIQSLKRDEMTPNEKTLQNRIKEGFAFKISMSLWEFILKSLESTDSEYVTSATEKNKIQIRFKLTKGGPGGYSYYQQAISEESKESQAIYRDIFIYRDKQSQEPQQFKVKEIEEDPSIGQMTKAIYLKDQEEWIGVDQTIDDVDYNLYDQLKSFLQEYFCSQDIEEDESNLISQQEINQGRGGSKFNHTQTTTDQDLEEVRAIAGGRYGCAQFVKLCGPFNLKSLSLGRLAQLVQYAVKEDVLRYHKTLLVWTTSVDKHKKLAEDLQKRSTQNAAIAAKLDVVKSSLIEILAESKSGMSLAQLPLYLRRKLPFPLDLNELGFPKLKDLILSMSDRIKLELKGHNHPFAYLIKSGRYVHSTSNSDDFQSIPKSKTFIKQGHSNLSEDVNVNRHLKNTINLNEENIQPVLTAFYNIMRECPVGYDSDKLPEVLAKKLGKEFSYKNYGCNSLLEFLKKYIMPTMDIEIIYSDVTHTDVYLIRSRQFFMSYTYQQIRAQQSEQVKNMNLMQQQIQTQQQQQQQFPGYHIQFINQQQQLIPNQQENPQQLYQMKRQDSGSSSLNISSQCYVPNHQSLYGGSTSANTSTQINVSHIRFNTADTLEMQSQSFQRQEINTSINPAANPFSKPPKHPLPPQSVQVQPKILPPQQPVSNSKQNSYKTFPPVQLQQQFMNQTNYQVQNFVKHQQNSSNATNFSLQSYVPPQPMHQPQGFRGFFLSPSHLQNNKINLNEQHSSQNPSNITSPLHSRAISFNNSAFGGQAAMQSTTSKSASQDFSIQSKILPNQLALQANHHMFPQSQSGFTSPNTQANLFGGMNFQNPNYMQGVNTVESTFGSPVPGSYRFDSINQGNYEESPPFNQDEEDDHQRDFQYIEKLVDDIDFKSGDDQSQMSIQSPQLSAVGNMGLRIPISNFNGYGPGITISNSRPQFGGGQHFQKKQWGSVDINRPGIQSNTQNHGKVIMQTSNSAKNILGGPIAEGGSSSSDENKRPSTVQEQKTEEDAEDNQTTAMLLNQKWQHLMSQQPGSNQGAETENLLFQMSSDLQASGGNQQQLYQQDMHSDFIQMQQQQQNNQFENSQQYQQQQLATNYSSSSVMGHHQSNHIL